MRGAYRGVLRPWSGHALGRSLNFSFGPSSAEEVRSAFAPDEHRRLTELDARCDPHGLLLRNHAIPPAAGG